MPFFLPALIASLVGGGAALASQAGGPEQPSNPYEKDQDFYIDPKFRPTTTPKVPKRRTGPTSFDALMRHHRENLERQKQLKMESQRPKPPGINDILAQLESLQDPSRYMGDPSMIEQQAISEASAQYDPLIAQLRSQMGSAQSRARGFDTQLQQMFGGLSSSLREDIPKLQETYTETKADTAKEYEALRNQIQQSYDQTQAEQEAMYKRLNIEAAAPDILPQQMRDRDFFQNIASSQGQTMQSALGLEERGATEFSRRGSQIAEMEGTQRRSDLGSQLQEMMGAYEGQIGAHEAAKQAAISSARNKISGQINEQALDRAQRDFDNYIKSIQLGRSLESDQRQGSGPVQSLSDIPGRATGFGLSPYSAGRLQDVFSSSVGSNEFIIGGLNKYGTPATKEALAQQIMEEGRRAGLSQQELNVLQNIALEYFGRS